MVRNKYPEKTVDSMLQVAQKLFFEKGYDNTTMQDIVNSGFSKGAIYYHFKSKKEIFNRIMSQIDTTADDLVRLKNDASLTGLEKIQQLFELTLKNDTKINLMRSAKSLFNEPKVFGEIYLTNMRDQAPKIAELVRIGIEDSSIMTDFPDELAELIVEFFSIWLGMRVYFITTERFYGKLAFYHKIFRNQGVKLLTPKLLENIKQYYRKINAD
ncbi:TetR family transcriptional regulator [Lactococcus hodotermopsidis]|uniref:TetR family transcriptional regulator n=1 Tax=Pseudolactococcus hodotermopsidis TaxID=2709157 RepID=A0A6A0B9V1_9LACT|nr:TetR/AcrR family transcriptional regulator [Lactococcus hodotermopsidis]GFH41485.1 TetR family transcriptional regulator [Lactococcus hodotermopsidis]